MATVQLNIRVFINTGFLEDTGVKQMQYLEQTAEGSTKVSLDSLLALTL